ncbi:MAG: AAA family ATPase [Microcystaceae cyanobacterium]
MSTEKLIVKNFLNLEDIELDLKKINIIIGRQAEGKSILAKLVYFFRNFFVEYRNSVIFNHNKREFDKKLRDNFQQIFPRYAWKEQDFKIIYNFEQFSIELYNKVSSNNRHRFTLSYSEELSKVRRSLCKVWQKQLESNPAQEIQASFQEVTDLLHKHLFHHDEKLKIDNPVFMPAGRSFFANVESNIFSFLLSNVSLDYFIKDFGSDYEFVKKVYQYREEFNSSHYKKLNEIINNILAGTYVQQKGEDYISTRKDGRKIHIANASSGQQEFLPMAIILSVIPFVTISKLTNHIFFIEEPEAHLFPKSQKIIIDLIAFIFNVTDKNNRFFITTHTPYVLTAFNNLIQAGNTLKAIQKRDDSPEKLKQLYSIVPKEQILDLEDIGAYLLENGQVTSIIDPENKIIDAQIIDEVSNQIFDTFQQLVDLEIED